MRIEDVLIEMFRLKAEPDDLSRRSLLTKSEDTSLLLVVATTGNQRA